MAIDGNRSTFATLAREHPLLGHVLGVHRNKRGEPMEYQDMPFLIPLLVELPTLEGADVVKGVQVGVTELFIAFVLWAAGYQGRIAAYVLSKYGLRDSFVQDRVDPHLQEIPEYRRRLPGAERGAVKGATNLKLKRFGAGVLRFLGSNTAEDFLEFSADVMVVDEHDACDQRNLAKAKDRLRESAQPQFFRIGNPTIPGRGIEALFDEGDQRRWHHQCGGCGHLQPLEWKINVVEEVDGEWVPRDPRARRDPTTPVRPVCRRCREPFRRRARGARWIALNPAASRRSYRITRLDVLSQPLRPLIREWRAAQGRTELLEAFYAGVLGRAYEPEGSRLTHADLERARCAPPLDRRGGKAFDDELVTAGIDVGALLHLTVSVAIGGEAERDEPERRARLVAALSSWEELEDALERYRVDVAVIDADPETTKAKELRDALERRGIEVWLCRFHKTPRVGSQRYGWRLNEAARLVTVDRTQAFDVTFDDLLNGDRTFPEDADSVLGWTEQMRAPARRLSEKGDRFIWDEGSKADHFRLSDVYDRIAYDLAQEGGDYLVGDQRAVWEDEEEGGSEEGLLADLVSGADPDDGGDYLG